VLASAVHGVLSGPAMSRIDNSPVDKLVVTNTIPIGGKLSEKTVVLSVARLLAQAIQHSRRDRSRSCSCKRPRSRA
jgi:ribose-phosphate pyrophosphokinase